MASPALPPVEQRLAFVERSHLHGHHRAGFAKAQPALHCGIGAHRGSSHREFEPDGPSEFRLNRIPQRRGILRVKRNGLTEIKGRAEITFGRLGRKRRIGQFM